MSLDPVPRVGRLCEDSSGEIKQLHSDSHRSLSSTPDRRGMEQSKPTEEGLGVEVAGC